jgi:fructokinase
MRIGIDLGGTKIEAIALDDSGAERARERTDTPSGDYEGTIRGIAGLVAALEQRLGSTCSVGVGTPGAISPFTGVIKNANSQCLNGRPLDKDLAWALGRPVRLANDADCFALSEATDGSAVGARAVFGVILGTGVGGGIVIGGKLLRGANAIAGEWGHNPLPWRREEDEPAPRCWCGKSGCIEAYLSGPALTRDHARWTAKELDPAQVEARAAQGDPEAEASLFRYEDRLARALASVINVLDPNVIVLGGGLSNVQRLYQRVPRYWGRYVFSDHVATKLVAPRYGDSSGVRGAAWLW